MSTPSVVAQILDLARWAPSGDNTQPWRFEVLDDLNVVVHGFDTREHCVYDLDGRPSQISLGALLETMVIAATAHGLRTEIKRRLDTPETHLLFDVRFFADATAVADPLARVIRTRSVQRRAMQTRRLNAVQVQALEAAVAPAYGVRWIEGPWLRRRAALLMFRYAKLRLTMPEAYLVHRDVIEWNARFSTDRVPDQALGIDPLTVRLMRFAMKEWSRVQFFNRFLAGTWIPRIQMELIPGFACAAHFVIAARNPLVTVDDYIFAGRATQRFWLTATQLGLMIQPEMTPLIFTRYVRERREFSQTRGLQEQAQALSKRWDSLVGEQPIKLAVFMGRIGSGAPAGSRSTRRELDELIIAPIRANDSAIGPPRVPTTTGVT